MADKRVPRPKFTTPRGKFVYPRLDKPDYGTEQYPCKEGRFSTKFVLPADAPETQALLAKLAPLHQAAVEAGHEAFKQLKVESRKKLKQLTVNELYTEVLDKVTEEPTGELLFSFKVAYATVMKTGKRVGETWYRWPAIFDAKGKPMNKYSETGKALLKCPAIWGGSEGKITFDTNAYFIGGTGMAGLSTTLLAAQVIKLVQGTAQTADEYGFAAEEGYEAGEPVDEAEATTEADVEGASGDQSDF